MQLQGFFVGKVSQEPKRIDSPGKQPFIAFQLESKTTGRQYPDRLKVATYADKAPAIKLGDIVGVSGSVQAEAWAGNDGQPKAANKMWATWCQVFEGGTVDPAAVQQVVASVARGRTSVPPAGSPASVEDDGSIPF